MTETGSITHPIDVKKSKKKRECISRAISVSQALAQKQNILPFDGEFAESFGMPELTGTWLIWGDSGSGKTTFAMLLCKYLTRFEKVAYDSMEEGIGASIKVALRRVRMDEVGGKLVLLNNEPISMLIIRLKKQRAPRIVVIDSLQYSQMSYKDYIDLKTEFKNVLFLIISHAEGKEPAGKVAKKVRYDAFVKIRVEGYVAFVKSRYGGEKPFVIWNEGAEKYHGDISFLE